MILIDTSVMIDYFKGSKNPKVELFEAILKQKTPFGISSYTYQELLQGARDSNEFNTLREYLLTQKIYFLAENITTYNDAAQMFYTLRREGVTVRSTIDILIALTAIDHKLLLLHNDKDFDMIKSRIDTLKILERL